MQPLDMVSIIKVSSNSLQLLVRIEKVFPKSAVRVYSNVTKQIFPRIIIVPVVRVLRRGKNIKQPSSELIKRRARRPRIKRHTPQKTLQQI